MEYALVYNTNQLTDSSLIMACTNVNLPAIEFNVVYNSYLYDCDIGEISMKTTSCKLLGSRRYHTSL